MIYILYSNVLLFLGWLGVVKSIQHHTACLTLHTIATSHLDIKCNPDKIVYVINQLSINSLGKSYTDYIAKNDTECQNTTSSSCFRSITTDLSLDYTSKISHFCNGKHNCTIQYNDLKNPFVDMFTTSCECCIDHLFYIRIGSSYECLPCEYFVNSMYCFSTHLFRTSKYPLFHCLLDMKFWIGLRLYWLSFLKNLKFSFLLSIWLSCNANSVAFYDPFENLDIIRTI